MTSEVDKARQARRNLEKVCGRLERPSIERLNASAADIQTAVECLRHLEGELLAGPRTSSWAQLVAEVRSIEREVRRARALMDAAGQFYAGWARLAAHVDTAAANYTSEGKLGPSLVHASEVTLRG